MAEETMNNDGFEMDLSGLGEQGTDNQKEQKNDNNGTQLPDGLDPETIALAMAVKKAKEDPNFRSVLQSAISQNQTNDVQQQTQEDEDEKRLRELKAELESLKQKAQYLDPSSDEFNRISQRVAELELEILKLEPKVYVKKALTPIQQQQVYIALQNAIAYANNVLFNNPRLARIPNEKKMQIFSVVQQALNEVYQRDPRSLMNPQNVQSFVDAIIARGLMDVLLPPPSDPGLNNPSASTNDTVSIPEHVKRELKQLGISEEEYLKNLNELKEAFGNG